MKRLADFLTGITVWGLVLSLVAILWFCADWLLASSPMRALFNLYSERAIGILSIATCALAGYTVEMGRKIKAVEAALRAQQEAIHRLRGQE